MQIIKYQTIGEIVTAAVLIAILVAFLFPAGLLMPQSAEMTAVVLFALAFIAFLGFIWKEVARDEREYLHQLSAGRISFFTGSSILTIGIIYQALHHDIDPWLVSALAVMVLAKIVVRIYQQITH